RVRPDGVTAGLERASEATLHVLEPPLVFTHEYVDVLVVRHDQRKLRGQLGHRGVDGEDLKLNRGVDRPETVRSGTEETLRLAVTEQHAALARRDRDLAVP